MRTIVMAADLRDGREFIATSDLERVTTLIVTPRSALRARGFAADDMVTTPRFMDDPRRALLLHDVLPCLAHGQRTR